MNPYKNREGYADPTVYEAEKNLGLPEDPRPKPKSPFAVRLTDYIQEDRMSAEERLLGVIVLRAVEDLREARRNSLRYPENPVFKKNYDECRQFFLDETIRELGFEISGAWLLQELEKEEI